MKKYPFVIITTVVLFAAVLLFLLRGQIKPIDELLHPPEGYIPQGSIKQTIEETTKQRIEFLTVQNEEDSSTVFYEDMGLTSLISSETVAFYTADNSPDAVCFAVLKKSLDGKYSVLMTFQTKFENADKVDFSDIDGDGKNEIVLGLNSFDSDISQTLFVYDFKNKENGFSCEEMFECPYASFKIFDVDHSGTDDLFVVSTAASRFYENEAFFVSFDGEKSVKSGSVKPDASMNTVSNIAFDFQKQEKQTRIFVDGYTSDGHIITDVLLCEKGKNQITKFTKLSVPVISKRTVNIPCFDVDGDSFVEIPCVSNDASLKNSNTHIITWCQITDSGVSTALKMLENKQKGLFFAVKDDVDRLCNITSRKNGNILSFNLKSDNTLVFELYITDGSHSSNIPTDCKLLASEREFDYYCYITQEGEKSGISLTELKKCVMTDFEKKR